MPTDLLRRTAMKHFDQEGIKYTVASEDTILAILGSDDGAVHLEITHWDRPDTPFIAIKVRAFVRFPCSRAAEAAHLTNELNMMFRGTFFIHENRDINYKYEGGVTENSGPEHFEVILDIALDAFTGMYPIVMKVRWGSLTFDEASGMDEDLHKLNPTPQRRQLQEIVNREDSDSSEEATTEEDADEEDTTEEDTSKE